MTRHQWIVVSALAVVILLGLFALVFLPPNKAQAPSGSSQNHATSSAATSSTSGSPSYATIDNVIAVDAPFKNATVSSPLVVSGTARGAWYFEASAPVKLLDSAGKVIAQGHINAQGDWMTEDFVPFTATLTFPKQPAGSTGTLVLQNDNPSGDPERQKQLIVPVRF